MKVFTFPHRTTSGVPRIPFPVLPRSLRWVGVGLVASVIVYFSIFTTVPQPSGGPGTIWDKKLHVAAYATFAYGLGYATVEWQQRPWTRAICVLVTAVLFGIAIELIQGVLPMRYSSLVDQIANVIGATLVLPWFLVESKVRYIRLQKAFA